MNREKLRENLKKSRPVHVTKNGRIENGRGEKTTLKPTRFA